MNTQLVKDHMTSPVISISADTNLADTHKKMADNKVRRLPIVDGDRLVGIVSLNDVLEAKPSSASSLSIWELNYLVGNLKVKDIMCSEVFSIAPGATIGEAAGMMLDKKFSGIPVTENNNLIGIITESDIFRMLASA
jgi:acetoin utilization protein AcuB